MTDDDKNDDDDGDEDNGACPFMDLWRGLLSILRFLSFFQEEETVKYLERGVGKLIGTLKHVTVRFQRFL